jgi:asparagine synthase (glutamine-hydrolysing)
MCRIYGYLTTGKDENEQLQHRIGQVARQQQHGGPDAQNYHASKNYGIGSNRLAITDPTGGHQPYRFGDSIFVALNGEIYNHDDLRLELQQDGIVF